MIDMYKKSNMSLIFLCFFLFKYVTTFLPSEILAFIKHYKQYIEIIDQKNNRNSCSDTFILLCMYNSHGLNTTTIIHHTTFY